MKNKTHHIVVLYLALIISILMIITIWLFNNSSSTNKLPLSYDTNIIFDTDYWRLEEYNARLTSQDEVVNQEKFAINSGRGDIQLEWRGNDQQTTSNLKIQVAAMYNFDFSTLYADCQENEIIYQKKIDGGFLNIISTKDDDGNDIFYEIRHSTNPMLTMGRDTCPDTANNYISSSYKGNNKYLYATIADFSPNDENVVVGHPIEELNEFLEREDVASAIEVIANIEFNPASSPGTDILF